MSVGDGHTVIVVFTQLGHVNRGSIALDFCLGDSVVDLNAIVKFRQLLGSRFPAVFCLEHQRINSGLAILHIDNNFFGTDAVLIIIVFPFLDCGEGYGFKHISVGDGSTASMIHRVDSNLSAVSGDLQYISYCLCLFFILSNGIGTKGQPGNGCNKAVFPLQDYGFFVIIGASHTEFNTIRSIIVVLAKFLGDSNGTFISGVFNGECIAVEFDAIYAQLIDIGHLEFAVNQLFSRIAFCKSDINVINRTVVGKAFGRFSFHQHIIAFGNIGKAGNTVDSSFRADFVEFIGQGELCAAKHFVGISSVDFLDMQVRQNDDILIVILFIVNAQDTIFEVIPGYINGIVVRLGELTICQCFFNNRFAILSNRHSVDSAVRHITIRSSGFLQAVDTRCQLLKDCASIDSGCRSGFTFCRSQCEHRAIQQVSCAGDILVDLQVGKIMNFRELPLVGVYQFDAFNCHRRVAVIACGQVINSDANSRCFGCIQFIARLSRIAYVFRDRIIARLKTCENHRPVIFCIQFNSIAVIIRTGHSHSYAAAKVLCSQIASKFLGDSQFTHQLFIVGAQSVISFALYKVGGRIPAVADIIANLEQAFILLIPHAVYHHFRVRSVGIGSVGLSHNYLVHCIALYISFGRRGFHQLVITGLQLIEEDVTGLIGNAGLGRSRAFSRRSQFEFSALQRYVVVAVYLEQRQLGIDKLHVFRPCLCIFVGELYIAHVRG